MGRAPRTLTAAALGLAVATLLTAPAAEAEPGFAATRVVPRVLATTAPENVPYAAISCPTSDSCTAVGPGGFLLDAAVQEAGRPTVVSERGGVWSARTALPLPPGASVAASRGSNVSGVSCTSQSTCTAVGGFASSSGFIRTLVETETAGRWTPSSVPLPGDVDEEGTFTALWCASQGNCAALGFYGGARSTSVRDMVATENAGAWSNARALPKPKGSFALLPVSIACTSTTACTAVAIGLGRRDLERTYSWTERSGAWSDPTELGTRAGLDFLGLSLACPSTSTCLLAGELEGTKADLPVVATDTSGAWSRPRRIAFPELTPQTVRGAFYGIACASGTCEAVGSFTRADGKGTVGAAATWVGGAWSSAGLVQGVVSGGRVAPESLLSAVSCAAPTACVAIGTGARVHGRTTLSDAFTTTLAPVRTVVAPAPPLGARGTGELDAARLSWLPPVDDGGSRITSYTATVEPGARSCTVTDTSCSVTGLRNGHVYEVTVVASNGSSMSAPSVRRSFFAGTAPMVPRHMEVSVSGTIAEVSWRASWSPPGERVERYVARVTGGGVLRGCSTHALHCRIGNLAIGRSYVVTVVAQDASGTSRRARIRFTE